MKNKKNAILWLTVSILLLLIAYAMPNNIITVTMNPIINEFQLDGAAQGLMSSVMQLGSVIALLIAPLLQGRLRKFVLMMISGMLQLAMILLTGVCSNLSMLLVMCTFLGASGGLIDTVCNSYMVDLHPENSAKYLGLLHGTFGVGGLMTPLLVTGLLSKTSWRNVYLICGMIYAALFIASFVFGIGHFRTVGEVQAVSENKLTADMVKAYLKNRENLLLLLVGILYAASQTGIAGWQVRYITLRFDNAQLGSIGVSIFWACATISRFLAPMLPIKPMKLFIGGIILSGIAHAFGVLIETPYAMIVAAGIVGILSGPSMPVLLGEAAKGNEGITSLTTSAMLFVMCISRMITPLVLGELTTTSVVLAMLVPAFAAIFAGIFAIIARGGSMKAE